MILAVAVEAFGAGPGQVLRHHELHGYIPLPWENHRLFGAGFLVLGVILLVEALAGGVWHRASWRSDLWPAFLMVLGWGLIAVAFVDPNDRIIHFLMGAVMLAAGVAERRYRHGRTTLSTTNLFVAPALIAGGLEVGVFHSHGAMTSDAFLAHALLGATAVTIAAARMFASGNPQSVLRASLVAVLVLVLALELLGLSHGASIDVHGTQTFSG